MAMRIDQSGFPLITYMYDGPLSPAELAAYFSEQQALIDQGKRYAVVCDMSRGAVPPPAQRAAQAHWEKQNTEALRAMCLGVAFVVPNPIIRGAVIAFSWMRSPPYEHRFCSTLPEAVGVARGWLDNAEGRLN
jgi:hypothetical protein